MQKLLTMLAIAGVTLGAPAFAADKVTSETDTHSKVESKSDGSYEETSKAKQVRTDASGKSSAETKVDVNVDKTGEREKTTTTTQVDDPKGLFNKSKTVTKDKVKHKDGKVTVSHKKKVNGKTTEDHTEETSEGGVSQ